MPKQILRQMLLARRKSLSALEARTASIMIQQAFIATEEFGSAGRIGLYAPVHNEVETAEVFAEALATSRVAIYPAVRGESLEFRRVLSLSMLRKGAFGIPEPPEACEVFAPGTADLLVVPGIAFDMSGRRIGYGKGYYDRTLHSLEGTGKLVGFCYDFQLVETIAGEPHDVTMDLLITETRVVRPRD